MNVVRKIIVVLFGIPVSIGLSILVMIKGWGLEPKSFAWIIGVGFFGQIFARLIMEIGLSKK